MPKSPHAALRRQMLAGAFVAPVLLLGGCADRPSAVGFLPSAQQRLQSAGHWQIMANDVASAVSAYLAEQTPDADLAHRDPIAVMMLRGDGTVFADAFLGSLRTSFVQLGHPVAASPRDGTVLVGIDMMVIRHQPGSGRAWTAPGPLTFLAAGAAVGSYLLDKFPWGVTAVPLGLGGDAALAKPPETDTELLLTVSIDRDGFHVFRSSAVYYINARDAWHYEGLTGVSLRSLNDVPQGNVYYDIARKPYVMRDRR